MSTLAKARNKGPLNFLSCKLIPIGDSMVEFYPCWCLGLTEGSRLMSEMCSISFFAGLAACLRISIHMQYTPSLLLTPRSARVFESNRATWCCIGLGLISTCCKRIFSHLPRNGQRTCLSTKQAGFHTRHGMKTQRKIDCDDTVPQGQGVQSDTRQGWQPTQL